VFLITRQPGTISAGKIVPVPPPPKPPFGFALLNSIPLAWKLDLTRNNLG